MTGPVVFADRREAGRRLGLLARERLAPPPHALALGLVRGGAVTACHLASAAGLQWDILIVRKIGAPHQPEYAAGAYAEGGAYFLNDEAVQYLNLSQAWINRAVQRAAEECRELQRELRGSEDAPDLRGRDIILTDDGMATGLTMHAAIETSRRAGAASVSVAIPVLARDALLMLEDARVPHCYISCPPSFHAVGQFYVDFSPVTSDEVRELLDSRGGS